MSPPRIRARGRRPHPTPGRARGARLPAGELPARHPRRLPARVDRRPCPTSTRRSSDALLQPASTPSRCPRCCTPGMRLTIAFDDLSLPLPTMKAPDIRRPDHRAGADHGRRRGRGRRRADRRQRAAPADDRGRAQAHRGRAGVPLVLPAGRLLTNHDAEDHDNLAHLGTDRQGRGRRDQQAGRRVRPAGLRQRQPRRDGRRPQVGRRSGWRRTSRCGTTTTPRRWCTRARSWTTSNSEMHHSAWRMGRLHQGPP